MTEKQFRKLVDEHYDRIFRAARFMCGDAQSAEDLVHETFLAAADSFARFQRRSSIYTWLYGIMLNKFRRWIREKGAAALSLHQVGEGDEGLAVDEMLQAGNPPPEEAAERRETAQQVRQAMNELSADHRSVIALRYLEGMSYQQIAELLDCPLGTVKSRIHYALQRIARKLHDVGSLP